MQLKRLCLANGDEYEDVEVEAEDVQVLIQIFSDRQFITVKAKEKIVYINPDFVLSFEGGGHKRLSVI